MTLTNTIAGIALALAMLLTPHPEIEPDQRCTEDMSCWDCTTMGNRICGPDYEPETGEYIGGYN